MIYSHIICYCQASDSSKPLSQNFKSWNTSWDGNCSVFQRETGVEYYTTLMIAAPCYFQQEEKGTNMLIMSSST